MKKKIYVITIVVFIVICFSHIHGFAANETIELTGFNRDIIAEDVPVANFSDTFDVVNNYTFYSESNPDRMAGHPLGFPSSGTINSLATSGLSYDIQSYDVNNALFFNGPTGLTPGTLNLVSPDSYETLYILATSANGSSDIGSPVSIICLL